jgi:hypothetical protein
MRRWQITQSNTQGQTPTSIKATFMSDEAFAHLREAMEDAVAFERAGVAI